MNVSKESAASFNNAVKEE